MGWEVWQSKYILVSFIVVSKIKNAKNPGWEKKKKKSILNKKKKKGKRHLQSKT